MSLARSACWVIAVVFVLAAFCAPPEDRRDCLLVAIFLAVMAGGA